MKKKWMVPITTLAIAAAMAIPATAAIDYVTARLRPDYTIMIDGKEQTLRSASGEVIYPLVYEDSVYLPLRAMGQLMDKEVAWDNATKTVILTSEGSAAKDAGAVKETEIDLEKAKKIALEHAGLKEEDVIFVTAKPDYDDGRKQYDVEFYSNGMEYDYEIDAENGRIVEFDKDFEGVMPVVNEKDKETAAEITAEEAKKIALNHAGLSDVTWVKVEKDRDDGKIKYEIEFRDGRMEYEYEIDAESGKILKAEKDYDD